jgi:hypothetical protein
MQRASNATASKSAALQEARDGYRPKKLTSRVRALKAKLRASYMKKPIRRSTSPAALINGDIEVVDGTTGEDTSEAGDSDTGPKGEGQEVRILLYHNTYI